jgi:hypothetical protein
LVDDSAGAIIPPNDLPRILGLRFLSANQLFEQANITRDQALAIVHEMIQYGFFEEWLAPECPNCLFIWPQHQSVGDFKSKLFCPMCNESTSIEQVKLYKVYKIIKEPPWMD